MGPRVTGALCTSSCFGTNLGTYLIVLNLRGKKKFELSGDLCALLSTAGFCVFPTGSVGLCFSISRLPMMVLFLGFKVTEGIYIPRSCGLLQTCLPELPHTRAS